MYVEGRVWMHSRFNLTPLVAQVNINEIRAHDRELADGLVGVIQNGSTATTTDPSNQFDQQPLRLLPRLQPGPQRYCQDKRTW